MPSEPTTQRAVALIEEWFPGGGDGLDTDHLAAFRADLAAIEAEAREQERALADELAEALAEAIDALEFDGQGYEKGIDVLVKWEANR